ncbi:MAG TPA: sigma-70 family RNA polymerase sigma factor [Nannocystaceae bacterium]|nr:sigma-70 family RNA polymerase sigma factor [Nannocystaceae bacterium]
MTRATLAQALSARLAACTWEPDALARMLGAIREEVDARWSGVVHDDASFADALARTLDPSLELAAAFAAVQAADLWLADACARADAVALAAFERELMPIVDRAVSRAGLGDSTVTELRQRVRTALFVAREDRAPAIASYAGRAPLAAWLRVVAAREAAALARRDHHVPADDDEIDGMVEQGLDPELQLDYDAYRSEFRESFAEAFARLGVAERNLLRLHVLDRVGIDEIAAMHGVHRATSARWLKRVREQLYKDTRRGLMTRLRLSPSEFESALRLVRSQLDVSIARHLRGA